MSSLTTVEILERLVACPTVSRDSNLPLINWVRNFLAEHGIESHLVADPTGRKSNLFATVGPCAAGGVVLSGHTDVVPIDGQSWTSDPFTLTSRGSRLQARGACDMKGFIAAALSRIPRWQVSSLSRPVHLMLSYDEEVGCLGTPSMIAAAQATLPPPAAVIVGEPTNMRLATQHKGICALRTRVEGIEAHSSLTHQGVSAVMLAAELIARLGALSRELASVTYPDGAVFEPSYTTLSVNRIDGGTAFNILAKSCEFLWDVRTLPGASATTVLEQFSSFVEERLGSLLELGKPCTVETSVLADVPALQADIGAAEHLVRAAMLSAPESIAVPFATEGGQFQRAGWSTVICGPGNIEQAHKPDEFIERAELLRCEVFLDRVVARQCQ